MKNFHLKMMLVVAGGAVVTGAIACYFTGAEGGAPTAASPMAPAEASLRVATSSMGETSERTPTKLLGADDRPPEVMAELRRQHEARAAASIASMQPDEALTVTTPLALTQERNWSKFSDEEFAAVWAVHNSFVRAMQSAGDPASPEYAARWVSEQAAADERLVAFLGVEGSAKLAPAQR